MVFVCHVRYWWLSDWISNFKENTLRKDFLTSPQYLLLVIQERVISRYSIRCKWGTLCKNSNRKESLLTLHNPCSIVHCLIMSAIIPIHINTPMKIKRLRTIYSIDKDSGFTSVFKHAHSFSHHVWRLYYFDYNASIYLMMSYRHTYTVEVPL